MKEPSAATLRLRAALTLHRSRLGEVLERYGATSPRLPCRSHREAFTLLLELVS